MTGHVGPLPAGPGGAGGVGIWGRLRGRRWGLFRFRNLLFAALHGPKLSLKAQWPDLRWGWRPDNRPLSPHSFAHLARSGLERPFDK